jgi:hypothetical protein
MTPTAVPTGTPTPTPAGSATVIGQGGGTFKAGDQADLGSFGYQPNDTNAQEVQSVSVSVSNPKVFSSLTVTATVDGEQVGSATVSAPDIGPTTVFVFNPPIAAPASPSTLTFAFDGVISGGTATQLDSLRRVRLAGMVNGGRNGGLGGTGRLMLALSLIGLVFAPLTSTRQRRRGSIIAIAVLILATGLVGCGGSSSGGGTTGASSSQQVVALAITEGGSQVGVAGLPIDLGKIRKK